MSLRMDASLYSDVVRIERGDYLLFHCEQLSQSERDVTRYFFGCYYPRWHAFYMEEVRSLVGFQGYKELRHFPAYPLDVYVKEDGDTFLTDDFQVDNVLVLGAPQNQRDDDVKRFKVVSVDDTRLKTRTGKLPTLCNSSAANPDTMVTTVGRRVPVQVTQEALQILTELRDAYVDHAGGGIPELGVKAMGRPFRQVSDDGHRWITPEKLETLVRDSRAFGITASFSDSQRTQMTVRRLASVIFESFPLEEGRGVDYDVFMDYVRGPMNSIRKKAVWNTFRALDYDGDGAVKIIDVQAMFNAQEHPVVVADAIFSADKLLKGFLSIWDENNKNYGIIMYPEFLDYYSGLSAVIEKDEVFLSILTTSWKLPVWAPRANHVF